jgi:serine/threonine protein phosphatase PrpC
MSLALRYGVRSDVGHVREGNEDSGYAGSRLVAVADGMGGAAAGEVASRTVINRLADLDEDAAGPDVLGALSQSLGQANDELRTMVREEPRLAGMGTTVTALLVAGQRLGLVHVGDSRCYLYRGGELTLVTKDHTFVQQLVDAGEISEDEAAVHPKRSLILRALDGRDGVEMDLSVREGREGDRYLLCSDGLSSFVSFSTIAEALANPDAQAAADRLVDLALRAGGPDNITAIVADVVDDSEGGGAHTLVGAAAESALDLHEPSSGSLLGESGRRPRGLGLRRRQQPEQPTAHHRSRWVIPVVVLIAVLALALAAFGGWLYVRTQYYVGVSKGHVVVFRGVSGTVGPLHLSSVEERGPLVSALPSESQRQVEQHINADNLSDARRILHALEAGTSPDSTSPAQSPSSTPTPTASGITPSATSPSGTGLSATTPSVAVSSR